MPLAQRLIALQDPYTFIKACIYTRDEVDKDNPVKLAPMTPGLPGYKPYVETAIRVLEACPRTIFDKSRRMWISYTILAFYLHRSFTNTDQRYGIVTEKFDKSVEHLRNMKLMYENIPEEIYPKACRPTLKSREGLIEFEEIGSLIHAIASGPDQARQFGFSGLFFDEYDFWADQESTYAAALPTLGNTGLLTIATTHQMIATGEDSHYKKLLEDRLD